ncbi:alanine racemase [Glaciihabitans arcticus]|uniref:Alanine racemase n=1 Tax=Glaciihabitans arcticus TaxID=2668039 RepID=A0A4Q9GZG1_9MICO|nr:alanine racemase [Glaciihabitans arcticus]TBN57790.1 alanine racemase [Glaciihabitans arcticus]
MSGLRTARIDLAAISRNVETLRGAIGTAHTMVVVKANGYGHGAVESARAALDGGADWFGVVDFDEALALRDAGIDAPLLAWLHGGEADFESAIAERIDIGVHSVEQLERVAGASGTAHVHIKVDSGLGRGGVSEDDCGELFAAAVAAEKRGDLRVRGFFSHLAGADDATQVARFERMLGAARAAGLDPELVHLAATGGALHLPESRFDMVRIGIGAYGISPFVTPVELPLTPAMELSGEIVSAKRVPAGSGVSYDHTYVTDRETTLVLVPLGYADGVPRHASGAGQVLINGAIYPVAGRVAMDQFVVDVGDAAVKAGDRAVLFGDPATGAPSVQAWADAAGSIGYEIVARIGSRVQREYSA